jgi:hypothetical protein
LRGRLTNPAGAELLAPPLRDLARPRRAELGAECGGEGTDSPELLKREEVPRAPEVPHVGKTAPPADGVRGAEIFGLGVDARAGACGGGGSLAAPPSEPPRYCCRRREDRRWQLGRGPGDRGRAPLFRTLSLTFFSLGFAIFFAAGCLVPSPLLSRRAALRWRPCNCMYLEAAFSFSTPVPVRSGYRVQRGEVDAMSSVSWRKL